MTEFRLFPATNGPSTAVSYAGPFAAGVAFEVTTGGMWFEGYWWWVCGSGQPAGPQTFALWQAYGNGRAKIISAATVTSAALVPGQWNYIPIGQPIMLSIGGGANFGRSDGGGPAVYIACTGFTGGFPDGSGQFGAGGAYAAGITDGPLTAFSDQGGAAAAPWSIGQGLFSTSGDVTAAPPFGVSGSGNFWMDVQVSDTAPAGYSGSYRIWPNYPFLPADISNDTGEQTTGTEFWLSEDCTLDNIWFWSPPGVASLPSRCGVFDVSTREVVAGSDDTAPAWVNSAGVAASPGDGWVSCSYAGKSLTLPAGKYKAAVYTGGGALFYAEDIYYFSSGPGAAGIVNGPITVPNDASSSSLIEGEGTAPGSTVTGNSSYQDGPWSYPDTFDGKDIGETRWIDIEVTPVAAQATPAPTGTPTSTPTPSARPVSNASGFLPFFT